MPLKARPPEAVQKRLKLFMFSPAGVGKSTAATQFPRSYIIDGEKGTENYADLINASNSVVLPTSDVHEVVAEVKALLSEPHDFRTLVIDPITTIYDDLLEKSERKVGSEFGRHYGEANKEMKRLANLIMRLDMNVIITAHAKAEYGDGMKRIGFTFDGWKKLDYLFDLVIQLEKHGKARKGRVAKTRLKEFEDGELFDWSYAEIERRCGAGVLGKVAETVALASADQVKLVRGLLDAVRVKDGWVETCFTKAGVDTWEDMPSDTIGKCIDHLKKQVPAAA